MDLAVDFCLAGFIIGLLSGYETFGIKSAGEGGPNQIFLLHKACFNYRIECCRSTYLKSKRVFEAPQA